MLILVSVYGRVHEKKMNFGNGQLSSLVAGWITA